jgi:hypothetical protein
MIATIDSTGLSAAIGSSPARAASASSAQASAGRAEYAHTSAATAASILAPVPSSVRGVRWPASRRSASGAPLPKKTAINSKASSARRMSSCSGGNLVAVSRAISAPASGDPVLSRARASMLAIRPRSTGSPSAS